MNPDKITKLKDQVEYCLRYFPETRNSDITLTKAVWRHFNNKYILEFMIDEVVQLLLPMDNLGLVPSQDNIKRIRAQFNSRGLYYPTKLEVARKRKINESEWRSWLKDHNDAVNARWGKLINLVPESVWPDLPKQNIEHDYMCEICNKPAIIEWKFADEDGTYYTMRCADHPPIDEPEYQPNPL